MTTEDLRKIVNTRMPYGKYAGTRLVDLPERYVVWFSTQGYPEGELGRMLQIVYEIKVNGLEYLFISESTSIDAKTKTKSGA